MDERSLVAGVDSSTQSTKIVLRRLGDGAVVARGRASHPATSPPVSEQDPEAWWQALVEAFGQLQEWTPQVVAVAVSGQQHGLVALDGDGSAIRPAKLWNDTTSAPQAERLADGLGPQAWAEACGVVPVAAITVAKLAWLVEHEPAAIERIAHVMLPHDYLTWRLSGRTVTDRGDASGTGWWSTIDGAYRPDLLAQAGAGRDLTGCLPDVLGPTEAAGPITAAAAAALGLPDGVLVGPGTGDNMAAALGLGLRTGEAAMSLGTSGTVFAVASAPAMDPSGLVAGFADANGGYLPLACTLNATKVTDMVAANLGHTDHAAFAELALSAPPGSAGVIVVPWFDGERTPNLPTANGVITGLRPGTEPQHLARAAHEGVLCNLLEAADALAAASPGLELGSGELRLVGGGARSAAYQRLLAHLHQGPVRIPDDDETPATGAAVQAAAVTLAATEGSEAAIDDVVDRWRLRDGGTVIEPDTATPAGTEVRAAYRAVAEAEAQRLENGRAYSTGAGEPGKA